MHFVDEELAENDELAARQLQNMLEWRWSELKVSICIIKCAWMHDLDWIRALLNYCQLVCVANKEKRLAWCQEMIKTRKPSTV